ncbi:glycosyltransferase family 61 protein [Halostagnicola kamekurae]|uniref:glycosyltransferase family 61 protein n=1 Tax=Halostagnicola kamekurae TaxID=619731 RepID=UPI001C31536D|nr:glycosyltransferase family 61 protein [Halostagnicola kamekurae]
MAKALVNSPRHATATLNGDETPDIQFEMATILLPPWNNYYHWTIECLPRIRLLEMYAAEEGEYPDLLVPSNRSSWVNEMIDRVDYQGRVVTWNGDVAHIDRLVIPSFPDPTREECQWLRNRMRGDEIAGSNKKHIYISRTDATARRVDNIDEIQPVLDRYGFETYVLSELSVAEQINLFANAEVVVAPHGAGLANIVYADDVEVIELFGNKKIASFARLAEILDYGYIDLDCEQRGVNLVVDPDRLDTAIQSIVAE